MERWTAVTPPGYVPQSVYFTVDTSCVMEVVDVRKIFRMATPTAARTLQTCKIIQKWIVQIGLDTPSVFLVVTCMYSPQTPSVLEPLPDPMTPITRRRRKKRRFYWVELGFLLLGLIGLRPEILTEFFPNQRVSIPATAYYPQPLLQPVYQPVYQAPPQQLTYGYPQYQQPYQQLQQPTYQQYPAFYDSGRYDPARIASNPSQVTSRYATNPSGYATGSTSSNHSTPPVVWPEGYQPNGSNYYRR
jgi:hypothetical protein